MSDNKSTAREDFWNWVTELIWWWICQPPAHFLKTPSISGLIKRCQPLGTGGRKNVAGRSIEFERGGPSEFQASQTRVFPGGKRDPLSAPLPQKVQIFGAIPPCQSKSSQKIQKLDIWQILWRMVENSRWLKNWMEKGHCLKNPTVAYRF